MIARVVAYLLANAAAVLTVGSLSERWVEYENRSAIFVFALILGVINATIRPVLRLLTLPLTCLTFGLFSLVLNAALFGLAARLTEGVAVTTVGAVVGSIVASVFSGLIFSLLDER